MRDAQADPELRVSRHGDRLLVVVSVTVTVALIWGLVHLVTVLWPVLPAGVALVLFIALAVAVIGYPIYTLERLSRRYLERQRRRRD